MLHHRPIDWYIDLAPDALLVEVLQAQLEVARARAAACDISAIVSPVAPLAVMIFGSVAGEALAVDV